MPDERPLTVDEAAAYLRLSAETIRRMLRDGRLRGVQPAGRRGGWRVMPAEVRLLLERPKQTVRGTAPGAPSSERAQRALAQLRSQAERARERGDDAGAARFEQIAAGMAGETLQ